MFQAEPRLHRTGHGPPVILLHCLGVDHRVWDGACGTARPYAKDAGGPYHFDFSQPMRKLIVNGRAEMFKHDRSMPDGAVTIDYVLDRLVIAGSVDNMVDPLLKFREQIGDFGTLLYGGHDWGDPTLAKRSMELMATEVMPRVNAALARTVTA